MGCCITKDLDLTSSARESKENPPNQNELSFNLKSLKIIIKVGDITTEEADAIVSGTDNSVKNRSTSFL